MAAAAAPTLASAEAGGAGGRHDDISAEQNSSSTADQSVPADMFALRFDRQRAAKCFTICNRTSAAASKDTENKDPITSWRSSVTGRSGNSWGICVANMVRFQPSQQAEQAAESDEESERDDSKESMESARLAIDGGFRVGTGTHSWILRGTG